MSLILIHPRPDVQQEDFRLKGVIDYALKGRAVRALRRADELVGLHGHQLLFVLPLGDTGTNLEYMRLLARLRREPHLLSGCVAGLIVDCTSPLYTKSVASELALAANLAGCAFIGRPLVEGTGALANFKVQADNLGTDLLGAYYAAARELVERLDDLPALGGAQPELLVLHASSHHTSNTIALWEQVQTRLNPAISVTEIGLRNGTLADCCGCPYTTCLHFGEKGECFYGGVMQEEVCPAISQCQGLVMLCPNYNDALSANLTACINRLTALFRQTRFYDKALFAIVVSGYSGGDILARQLVAAINMNKSFYLPGHFAMLETANDPGQALQLPGIDRRLDDFAANIDCTMVARSAEPSRAATQ